MKITVIGNPVSGGGKTETNVERLAKILKLQGHPVEIFFTQAAGDARSKASRIEPESGIVVVAGGDGTLNEVLNGMADPSRNPIALLPTGNANVLARELGLPYTPEGIAEVIDRGIVRRLDMGLLGDRRFLLLVSSGFDAMVTENIQRTRSGPLGYRGYLLPILRVLASYRAPKLKITVDGQEVLIGAFVVVSNVRNYGGIFKIADQACCDSGRLDICVFPRGSIPALFRYALYALRGRVSTLAEVAYLNGSTIRIGSDKPVAVEVDGDYFGTTPVVIEPSNLCPDTRS